MEKNLKKNIYIYIPKAGSLAKTFKIFLPVVGLMVKVPVRLYLSCKLLLFQSLLLMSPDDGGFYATIVAGARLRAVLAVFVFIAWKEGMPDWREEKNEERSPCFQAAGVAGKP
uniref:Uncharacterized protein n=1 Tax=Monodon monoceros TaxID=40151 RepID=A0A8C6F0I9_MONMO